MSYAIPAGCKDARNLLIKAKTDESMEVYEYKDVDCVAIFEVESAYKAKFDRSPDTSEPYILMRGYVKGYRIDTSLNSDGVFPNGEQEIMTIGRDETKNVESISDDLLYNFMENSSSVREVFKPYTFMKTDRKAVRELSVAYRFSPFVSYEDENGEVQEINEYANIFKKGWLDEHYEITKLDKATLEVPVKATYIQCVDKETGDSVAVIKGTNYTEMDAMTSHYYQFTEMLDDIKDLESAYESDFSFEFGDESRYENKSFGDIEEEHPVDKHYEDEVEDLRSKEEIKEDDLIETLSAKIQADYEAQVLKAKAEKEKRIKELIEAKQKKDEDKTQRDKSKEDSELLFDDEADKLFGGDTVDELENEELDHDAEVAAAQKASDEEEFDDLFDDEVEAKASEKENEKEESLDRDKAVKHMEEVAGVDELDSEGDEFF